MNKELVQDVRRALHDPKSVCERLGFKPVGGGSYVHILCPVHDEKTPSCSVHVRDGGIAVKCHSCDWGGDVLHLIAAAYGWNLKLDFKEILAIGADLAGMTEQADALRDGKNPPMLQLRPQAVNVPPKEYPPTAEVSEFWGICQPVGTDSEATELLASRGIATRGSLSASLARVLHPEAHESRVPGWARYRGAQEVSRPWHRLGYRLILPAYDCRGAMSSVRAWRIGGDDAMPKRVPPSGFRASGLVLANDFAVSWLRGKRRPKLIVICEGEPDFLARATVSMFDCTVGILSGSWHSGFARRVPYGADVVLLTHLDKAGDRYAAEITKTLEGVANVRRWKARAA